MLCHLAALIRSWFSDRFKRDKSAFVVAVESEVPDTVTTGKLYLIGEDGSYWMAQLKCPCGCGDTINLPMSKGARPCWRFSGARTKPTLSPSVNRTTGCQSHFILRAGKVQWYREC